MMAYRKHKYGYAYRRIPLGEEEFTLVEQDDYYRFGRFHWHLGGNDERVYVVRSYKTESEKLKYVSLHREIMNNPRGLLVDHRNGDGLDNRQSNLRPATHSQNGCNRKKRKNTSSQFVGVSWDKRVRRWSCRIKHQNKEIWLGYFDIETEAAKAYDAAAKKYFGEFARLNFPEGSLDAKTVQ
jgi:hypothetical protein